MFTTNLFDNYNHITAVLTTYYSSYISYMKIPWRIQFLFWWYTLLRRKYNHEHVIKIIMGRPGMGYGWSHWCDSWIRICIHE